ncbi:cysteine desulfurase family protein [Lutibacter sp.]|uniref:cysteine desulfurase family protein n=1 Tax=Lutibacter sp. TaxID=1925666 RepID=UPI002736F71D|nr:cysteine desulfurase family protein [Lutibacter sp.]MDP3312119.1 cysteine desulfurase family protein [Lutibacter sp.]
MKKIYLDNAATTPILPEVINTVCESMTQFYGNPSSSHEIGRKAKSLVETARKNIAKHLNAKANEIYFTAGGSEADNLILRNAVVNLGIKTIISSKIEHHAVLHTIENLEKEFQVLVKWVDIKDNSEIDYVHLEALLKSSKGKILVSLMYVNNEIGTILDLEKVSQLCFENDALFHSDSVQGVGHFAMNTQLLKVDFFVASAHKFHGPKGVGFAYIKNGIKLQPMLIGGEQERGGRAGTENVHSILGMEKALEMAYLNLKEDALYIQNLKNYFIEQLKENFDNITFNGCSDSENLSSYIILNVRFSKEYSMLLFNLDIKGICASGGSACQSGSNKGSHVLNEILNETESKKTSVRFSFSKFNTKNEIDLVIDAFKNLLN